MGLYRWFAACVDWVAGELLEILGSIINGFAIPLKKEHLLFLQKALIPLHKPSCVPRYHQQLSYCIVQYVEKDPDTVMPVLRVSLHDWLGEGVVNAWVALIWWDRSLAWRLISLRWDGYASAWRWHGGWQWTPVAFRGDVDEALQGTQLEKLIRVRFLM